MDIQVCASCYVVDFKREELLMIYNKKLGLWLQPGGHIEGNEKPLDTAIREVKEETGIEFIPVGISFNGHVEPFAVENYDTRIGPQLDIQFIGKPIRKRIINNEHNKARWVPLNKVIGSNDINAEIKDKLCYILKIYKNNKRQ